MVRRVVGLLVVALVVSAPQSALGLGGEYGKEELKSLAPVGGQTPISGYWGDSGDGFFYAGDAKAFNQFIEAYAAIKNRKRKVVLHAGTGQASSPWDGKPPRDVPADWALHGWSFPLDPKWFTNPPGEPPPSRVDVWVGSRLKLQDLRIPAGLEVEAGKPADPAGEVNKFIADRKAPPGGAAAKGAESLRLTVELSDGSRLVGEASGVKDLPLQTSFGKVVIPAGQVESVRVRDDKGTCTVRFRNKDRLSGVLIVADWGDLKMLTAVGEVKVPTRLIRHCALAPARKAPVSVRASGTWERETPERAFDGDRNTDWNAGGYAPEWIEADLGAATPLAGIVLIPCQDIPGATTHEVWVSDQPIGDDRTKAKLVHTFKGDTTDHQQLTFDFPKGTSARYVQVRTTQSPTWIAWYEVEIRAR